MIGTYNTPYSGEVLAPEHLFQSIPEIVSKDDVISAACGLVERAVGISGLLTTNGGALNEDDTLSGLLALEAVIDQLNVVLHHRTKPDSTTEQPRNAGLNRGDKS